MLSSRKDSWPDDRKPRWSCGRIYNTSIKVGPRICSACWGYPQHVEHILNMLSISSTGWASARYKFCGWGYTQYTGYILNTTHIPGRILNLLGKCSTKHYMLKVYPTLPRMYSVNNLNTLNTQPSSVPFTSFPGYWLHHVSNSVPSPCFPGLFFTPGFSHPFVRKSLPVQDRLTSPPPVSWFLF